MKLKTLLATLLLCICSYSYPQAGKLFTADTELSNSLINQIFQDNNGVIWIATEDGLNRYDGSKFTIYRHDDDQEPNTLLNNYVHTLYQDKQGRFFIGLFNGLQVYDDATDTFEEIPMYLSDGARFGAHVLAVLERKNGEILISTGGLGLFRLETKDGRLLARQVTDLIPTTPNFLYEDPKGNLWAGTDNEGLYCLLTTNKLKHYPAAVGGKDMNTISASCQDTLGNLYFGSLITGLFRYDQANDLFDHIACPSHPNLPIKSLCLHDANEILVGTDGAGLKSYTPGEKHIRESNLSVTTFDFSKAKVHSLLKDKNGNTWLGIFQRGVMMLHDQTNDFGYIGYKSVRNNTIGSNCVMSLFQDHEGTLWVGTDSDGLYGISPDGKAKVHFPPSQEKSSIPPIIMSIYEDSNHDLWLGSYLNGLYRLNRQTGKCDHIPLLDEYQQPVKHVYSITEDREKRLWIGSMGSGLYCLDLRSRAITQYNYNKTEEQKIHNTWINTLLVGKNNKLYIGTYDGIACLDLEKESFTSTYGHKWALANRAVVYTLYQDPEGNLWAGTSDGLLRIDTGSLETTRFTHKDGLPNDVICAIRSDEAGDLWITTNYGLSHMDIREKSFINYYATDGLQGNEFSKNALLIDPQGQFFCGGINGITSFHPQEIAPKKKELHMRLTGFYLYDQPVRQGMKSGRHDIIDTSILDAQYFHLSHKDNSFSLEFATLDFVNPEQITYAYSLNNAPWANMQTGSNRLTFSDLPPGIYHIRVMAKDYGVHSEVKQFTIKISPAWYASIWAKLIYILVSAGIIFLVFLQIKQRYRARQRLQKHIHEQEINEAKLQFFINISHEIRTPLSLVISPLKKLMTIDKDQERQNAYSIIHRNTERILQLINQLLDIRKIDKGQMLLRCREMDIVTVVEETSSLFDDLIKAKQIEFRIHRPMEELKAWVDPKNFDKILINVLSNAIKFAPKNGKIDLSLSTLNKEGNRLLEIIISDNGTGINENEIERIFERFYQASDKPSQTEGTGVGLHLTRSLVQLHHGTIKAENNPDGQGCRFIIRLPLGNAHLKAEEMVETPAATIYPEQPISLLVDESTGEDKKIRSKSKRNILVVDDDKEIRKYICRELASEYHTVECANGKEALAQMLKKVPDLVISDVMMPEMDGITLCRKIRQNVNINHIPVILLTAKTKEEDNLEGLDTGADAYILKPFNIEVLRKTVQTMIRNREMLRNSFSGSQLQKDKLKTIHIKSADDKLLEKVMKMINDNISNPDLNVEMIASRVGISRVHLHRKLKELTNQSTRDLIRNIRLQQAATLLSTKTLTVTDVATATGFANLTYFSNAFKEMHGMPPMAYMEAHLKKPGGSDADKKTE